MTNVSKQNNDSKLEKNVFKPKIDLTKNTYIPTFHSVIEKCGFESSNLFGWLYSNAQSWHFSISGASKVLGWSKTKTGNAMNRLIDAGFIVRTLKRVNPKTYHYELIEPCKIQASVEIPKSGFRTDVSKIGASAEIPIPEIPKTGMDNNINYNKKNKNKEKNNKKEKEKFSFVNLNSSFKEKHQEDHFSDDTEIQATKTDETASDSKTNFEPEKQAILRKPKLEIIYTNSSETSEQNPNAKLAEQFCISHYPIEFQNIVLKAVEFLDEHKDDPDDWIQPIENKEQYFKLQKTINAIENYYENIYCHPDAEYFGFNDIVKTKAYWHWLVEDKRQDWKYLQSYQWIRFTHLLKTSILQSENWENAQIWYEGILEQRKNEYERRREQAEEEKRREKEREEIRNRTPEEKEAQKKRWADLAKQLENLEKN